MQGGRPDSRGGGVKNYGVDTAVKKKRSIPQMRWMGRWNKKEGEDKMDPRCSRWEKMTHKWGNICSQVNCRQRRTVEEDLRAALALARAAWKSSQCILIFYTFFSLNLWYKLWVRCAILFACCLLYSYLLFHGFLTSGSWLIFYTTTPLTIRP